jgi:hypothetical protein
MLPLAAGHLPWGELKMSDAPFQTQAVTRPFSGYWSLQWWTETGSAAQPIQFFIAGEANPLAPLGDLAFVMADAFPTPLLYMPSDAVPDALAHPVDYVWILDDRGSGNSNDISYWWPVAPPNYVALGLVWSHGVKPLVDGYWCVHKRFVTQTTASQVWSDAGQGWNHHNGDLLTPEMPAQPPANVIVPQTFLSAEAMGNGMGAPYVLCWP